MSRVNPMDGAIGRFIQATEVARNDLIDEINRSFRPNPWPEAREDARLVLREYVTCLKDPGRYQVSEDETLDKLGFGEPLDKAGFATGNGDALRR